MMSIAGGSVGYYVRAPVGARISRKAATGCRAELSTALSASSGLAASRCTFCPFLRMKAECRHPPKVGQPVTSSFSQPIPASRVLRCAFLGNPASSIGRATSHIMSLSMPPVAGDQRRGQTWLWWAGCWVASTPQLDASSFDGAIVNRPLLSSTLTTPPANRSSRHVLLRH